MTVAVEIERFSQYASALNVIAVLLPDHVGIGNVDIPLSCARQQAT